MDQEKSLREIIEAEKPFFDFAAYLLTIFAWWAAIAFASHLFPSDIWRLFGLPYLLIPAFVLGVVLTFRFTGMVEKLVYRFAELAFGSRFPYWHPFRISVVVVLLLVDVGLYMVPNSVVLSGLK